MLNRFNYFSIIIIKLIINCELLLHYFNTMLNSIIIKYIMTLQQRIQNFSTILANIILKFNTII